MVRDLCQGGHGVALVVGRAGTGKTFALGIARHAWQLDGYRLLGETLREAHETRRSFLEVGVAYVRFAVTHRAHFEVAKQLIGQS